jgi:probable F420-dependent oxidoreductase
MWSASRQGSGLTPSVYRFGLAADSGRGPREIAENAARAEQAGFDTYVMSDIGALRSPLPTLVAAADATSQVRVGTFVLNVGLWDPGRLVRELATVDQLTGGRLEIGLGTGISTPDIAQLMPPTRAARVQRLEEVVTAIEQAAGEQSSPFAQARPGLLIAVTGDQTARIAAKHAATFIVAAVPPVPKVTLPPGQRVLPTVEATEARLAQAREWAGGRDLEISVGVPVQITPDREGVARELAKVHTYLTPEQIIASPKLLIGTVDQIAERILDYGERLGLTYNVVIGVEADQFAPVIQRVRQATEPTATVGKYGEAR